MVLGSSPGTCIVLRLDFLRSIVLLEIIGDAFQSCHEFSTCYKQYYPICYLGLFLGYY